VDPTIQFCHNPACPLRGRAGQGNIRVLSRKEQRYQCTACARSLAATGGTPFFRLRTAAEAVTLVLTLLSHGCPLRAIVAAFGFDERTIADWQARAGQHCQAVHAHLVQAGQVDVRHVQADELWVKMVGQEIWLALAIAAPSRLWPGGVISPHRDRALISRLAQVVRAGAVAGPLLVCVGGLASYVRAFLRVSRHPARAGRRGRPRLVVEKGLLLGQVVKQYAKRRVVGVSRRVVRGTAEAIGAALAATAGGTGINTAYVERLNATLRSKLVPLVRRGRALAHREATLIAGLYLVGTADNFCWVHASLRQPAPPGAPLKWRERTPAMAAGLTGHCWTMSELLRFQVPLPLRVAPTRRGRPPKHSPQPVMALAV
jgi:transposase-like protein